MIREWLTGNAARDVESNSSNVPCRSSHRAVVLVGPVPSEGNFSNFWLFDQRSKPIFWSLKWLGYIACNFFLARNYNRQEQFSNMRAHRVRFLVLSPFSDSLCMRSGGFIRYGEGTDVSTISVSIYRSCLFHVETIQFTRLIIALYLLLPTL